MPQPEFASLCLFLILAVLTALINCISVSLYDMLSQGIFKSLIYTATGLDQAVTDVVTVFRGVLNGARLMFTTDLAALYHMYNRHGIISEPARTVLMSIFSFCVSLGQRLLFVGVLWLLLRGYVAHGLDLCSPFIDHYVRALDTAIWSFVQRGTTSVRLLHNLPQSAFQGGQLMDDESAYGSAPTPVYQDVVEDETDVESGPDDGRETPRRQLMLEIEAEEGETDEETERAVGSSPYMNWELQSSGTPETLVTDSPRTPTSGPEEFVSIYDGLWRFPNADDGISDVASPMVLSEPASFNQRRGVDAWRHGSAPPSFN